MSVYSSPVPEASARKLGAIICSLSSIFTVSPLTYQRCTPSSSSCIVISMYMVWVALGAGMGG